MTRAEFIMALSTLVTALSALGVFRYVRRGINDGRWSRRVLEGEDNRDGLVMVVERVEKRSRQNTRALRREGTLPDGGRVQEGSDE